MVTISTVIKTEERSDYFLFPGVQIPPPAPVTFIINTTIFFQFLLVFNFEIDRYFSERIMNTRILNLVLF